MTGEPPGPSNYVMRFSVLATDFDGTIAHNGVLDPEAQRAIADLRGLGIVVLLVTGRILRDLARVAGSLTFVDGIVAENGAVLAIPANASPVVLGSPPAPEFVDALRRKHIRIEIGESIVEADAATAPTVIETIRTLELPGVVIFNRDRLMSLPSGINKGTGLKAALKHLRLSPDHVLGLGDAENDHDLFDACGCGVAVGWGSQALKDRADDIVNGDGPSAVAAYLRAVASRGQLPCHTRTAAGGARPGPTRGGPTGF